MDKIFVDKKLSEFNLSEKEKISEILLGTGIDNMLRLSDKFQSRVPLVTLLEMKACLLDNIYTDQEKSTSG